MSFIKKLFVKIKNLVVPQPLPAVTITPVSVEVITMPIKPEPKVVPKVAPKIAPANQQRAKRKRRPKPKSDQPKQPVQSPKPVKGDKAK